MKRLTALLLLAVLALASCAHHASLADLLAPETLQQAGARAELDCLRKAAHTPAPSTQAEIDAALAAWNASDPCLLALTYLIAMRPNRVADEKDMLIATSARIPGAMLPGSMHAQSRLSYYVVYSLCSGKTYASASTPNPVTCQ